MFGLQGLPSDPPTETGLSLVDREPHHGYRFAGGAPLYVSSWALFGNPAATRVDDYALDHYAAGGPLSHVLRYPSLARSSKEFRPARPIRLSAESPRG